jgi:hypothetical protein
MYSGRVKCHPEQVDIEIKDFCLPRLTAKVARDLLLRTAYYRGIPHTRRGVIQFK